MSRLIERKCDTCGSVFYKTCKTGKSGSFCSRNCRASAKTKRCSVCNAEFVFSTTYVSKHTCSEKCRYEASASARTKPPDRTCKWCGGMFRVSKSQAADKPSRWCSNDCVHAAGRITQWAKKVIRKRVLRPAKARFAASEQQQWKWACQRIATALQYKIKRQSLQHGWKEKCRSMASCNRHRDAVKRRSPKATESTKKWTSVTVRQRVLQTTLKDAWRYKCNNMASNQRKRMRRKHAMKQSRGHG